MATEYTHGKILPREVSTEMRQSFMDYAMSVIMSRALPDVRDGLKPVQRRILYAMNELGLHPNKGYKKSARIVGEVLGKYHPHGEAAVYDAMVRMAQDFSYRYPLVDGHGNFGSIDGDPAAAMRYTEVRMTRLAMELLTDIDKETVDFAPNFDETLEEPRVLTSRFPNLLVNGTAGIAVGMATNIPPHNLREVVQGLIAMINNPAIDTSELLKYIKGPDFPTSGIILGREGIRKAYKTGKGSITLRGEAKIETLENGKQNIIITELPYQVNKAKLIERIADLVRDKKIEGITDLRDETDRHGIRIVIELKKDVNPHIILNQLYKFTPLQQNFGIIMLALVNNQPKVLSLRDMLFHYLEHQREIITRRTRYELRKAEERLHILEGFRIALDNLDEVIALIRKARDADEAREGLMQRFPLSKIQAQAILDMRLQRLTGLEREKIEQEYTELKAKAGYLQAVLADPQKIDNIIARELTDIAEKYGDARRTKIVNKDGDLEIEDLIADEDVVITITHQGYIKRMPVAAYRSQQRGGRGIAALNKREDDFLQHLFITSTHKNMLFLTNFGQAYRKKVYEIPEGSRQARGTAIVNLIPLRPGEKISAVLQVQEFSPDRYLVMATREGMVKKTSLDQYDTSLRTGLIAIRLQDKDELVGASLTDGDQEIMLFTAQGLAIRFKEQEIRPVGRAALGVKGIRLRQGDKVVEMAVLDKEGHILLVTEEGFGKRTSSQEFRVQTRGGKGVIAAGLSDKSGKLAGAKIVTDGDDFIVVTAQGVLIRQQVDGVSVFGRTARGLKLIKLDPGDRVAAVARVVREERDAE
ncbi:MAG TPA: DNA gyrase subunit A [Bacillota bacterium]|nr:DNA gyrase subunit A [Bacillota bacterium]HPZ91045.1 DNA gyrase subunit A [Bacillota bacterium]HQE02074.1 DNA gyrase subunit A [Bacillota bacterium]